MAGSVGAILGETLFAGKVVYFERGNDDAQLGDADFSDWLCGQNCFAPADSAFMDVLAGGGKVAGVHVGVDEHVDVEGPDPVRVVATSEARATKMTAGVVLVVRSHCCGQAGLRHGCSLRMAVQGNNVVRQHAQPFSESIQLIGSALSF
jgi:hypothetical protein